MFPTRSSSSSVTSTSPSTRSFPRMASTIRWTIPEGTMIFDLLKIKLWTKMGLGSNKSGSYSTTLGIMQIRHFWEGCFNTRFIISVEHRSRERFIHSFYWHGVWALSFFPREPHKSIRIYGHWPSLSLEIERRCVRMNRAELPSKGKEIWAMDWGWNLPKIASKS